ncbi:MAG: ribosomal L7Ae/L30e/S12e/Gadd45 family protein [Clostridia bacterium]|nr:ribosomal L7Ae/L30e/S12e/Gadd45 family protein [Clostridia bacterium]
MSGTDRLLGAIGICRRAGKLICGVPLICTEMRKGGTVCAVLAASDASDNTKKKLSDKCKFYGVALTYLPYTAEQLAGAVGKSAPIGAVAITDAQLFKTVEAHLPK